MNVKLILWEIWAYVQVVLVWYLFKQFANRNVVGDMTAGVLIGLGLEFITEPLWDYHFLINYYKDTPVAVPLSWGVMFTLVVFVSEKMYCKFMEKPAIRPYDKRIFVFDLTAGLLLGMPMEMIGVKTGIWDYRFDLLNWNWGEAPLIHMPYEALFAYALVMFSAPTFVRFWQGAFESRT